MIFSLFLLFLTSCAVGPNYHRPEVSIPTEWNEAKCEEMEEEPWVCWWKLLNDPILDELIAQAIACNFDIDIAEAKLEEARGHYKMISGQLWPKLSFSYGMSEYHISGSYPFITTTDRFPAFEVNFDASWELDIFGGGRKLQAAKAHLQTEEECRRSVLISLISEVARNYIELRSYQTQRQVLSQMLAVHRKLLEMIEFKVQEALTSESEFARAHANVLEVESKLEGIDEAIFHAKNHISLLVSDLPGACQDRLAFERPIPTMPSTLLVGLPSTLLCRRPDIRKAERKLAAYTAEVGISVSELFPKIDLSANVGYWSQIFSQLFNSDNESDKYRAFLKWPFFEGGAVLAKIAKAKAMQKAVLYDYLKTVLGAFHEVENRILSYQKQGKRMRQSMGVVLDRCTLLTGLQAMRDQGLISNFQVEQEQLVLLDSQRQYIEAQARLAINYIALYKALGGGWEAFADR